MSEPTPARAQVLSLASLVGRRLRSHDQTARVVSVKMRDSSFRTWSRQATLPDPAQDDTTLRQTAVRLLEAGWGGAPLRLLGVEASRLSPAHQLDLLSPFIGQPDPLDAALDQLNERFGELAPHRGVTPSGRMRGGRQAL